MLNIELDIQPETAQRLRHLMAHFDDQERFAQHIIDFQVQSLKRGILNLRLDLKKFESQYQMPSETFYHQFEQGLLDDSEDYILWSGLYEMLQDNQQQLYDNAPHHQKVTTFPHHKHVGDSICDSIEPSLADVLLEIADYQYSDK